MDHKHIAKGLAIYQFIAMLGLMGLCFFFLLILIATKQPLESYIIPAIVLPVLIFTAGKRFVQLWGH